MSTAERWPGEEPWEQDIHELLASLPVVEPPDGFLQRAVDHRPKYAGRLTAVAAAGVAATTLALVGLGLVGDPAAVAPTVPALTQRHTQVLAGMGPLAPTPRGATFERVDDPAPVALPRDFEPQASMRDGDVVQIVYRHGGRTISLFAERGTIDWTRLPAEGLGQLDGRSVWSDADRRIVILQAGSHAVAIVGMDVEEAMELLRHEEPDEVSVGDRFRALTRDVARQAGFPLDD